MCHESFILKPSKKSSKAHKCGRKKPKKKNRERGDAFGVNDVCAVEELHLFH